MTGISLYLSGDFQIQVSEGLVLKFDQDFAQGLALWAIDAINGNLETEHFVTEKIEIIKNSERQIKPLEVDQSNLSFQFGNYLVKIKKELDLTNRNLNIVNSLNKSNFQFMPKYYGSLSLKIFGKVAEFISIYEFIDDSLDGWTWLPKKLVNKNDSWVNEIAILTAQLHRDLRKVEADTSRNFLDLTDQLVQRDLPDLNQSMLSGIENFPHPEKMLKIWKDLEEKYFQLLDEKKQNLKSIYQFQITHGDFHIGQVLKNESNYFVIDFDGSPVLNKELRNTSSPIEDDLAHMVLSISLAARVAERVNQLEYGSLNSEVEKCQNLFLTNYQENRRNFDQTPVANELIEYLRFRQYFFEIIYALKFLPRWLYAPVLSLKEEIG